MHNPKHVRACAWLIFATSVWGLSFPFIKASWLAQHNVVPEMSSMFHAALLAVVRFGASSIVIGIFSARTLRLLTKLELEQGLGLGVFGGLGIVFQMDGLAHTPASTSAFLTQFTCIFIPLWVGWRTRSLPRFAVFLSLVMVMSGVAILSRFDWHELKMGRGEAETILSALFFSGQILWLERPRYSANNVAHFSVVMFTATSLLVLPLALFTVPASHGLFDSYRSVHVLALVAVITIGCTVIAYTLMNIWQPHVIATEAGLIYCVEPLFASLFALFLPGWMSRFAGIDYANEHLTSHLLVGGGLITAANVLIQIEATLQRRKASRITTSPLA